MFLICKNDMTRYNGSRSKLFQKNMAYEYEYKLDDAVVRNIVPCQEAKLLDQ